MDLNFFTRLPDAAGRDGRRHGQRHRRQRRDCDLLASLIGIPIGFLTGVYLSEFGGRLFAFSVRYMADLLNGVPSIVIGIFVWGYCCRSHATFSALAGGLLSA